MKRYLIILTVFLSLLKSESVRSQNVLIVSGSNSFSVNSQVLPLGALVLNVFRDSLHVELDFVSCSVTIPPYYYTPVFISNRDLTKYYLNGVQCTDVADFRTFYNTYMVSTGGGGGGGVSSVGLTAPSSVFSVSGTPITTSGTLGLVFKGGLAANKVLATPDGTTGAISLRTISITDIPYVTSFASPTNTTVPTSSAVNGLVSNYALKTTSLTINGVTQTFTSTPSYSVGTMTGASISTANGFAGSSDGNAATPIITMSTTVTSGNLLQASTNGSIISAEIDRMNALNPTALKTSAYTALPNDLVTVNTTSGGVTITLTATPTDKTLIAIKHIIQGGTNVVTVTCGGSDVFNKTSGTTSFTMPYVNQSYLFQYQASTGIWFVIADDLPKSALDAIYTSTVIGTSNISVTGSPSAGFTVSLVASPSLQGNPTATTQSLGDNSTKLATTGYVDGTKVAYSTTNSPTFTGTVTVNGVSVFSSVATFNSTINKVTITAPANGSTITIADGKTFTCANTIRFTSGADGQSYALPTTSATLARTDAGQTFTGTQTFSSASSYSWATQGGLYTTTAGTVTVGGVVDYYASSTIGGFTSPTITVLSYQRSGQLVNVFVDISGTSNAITTTFTIPFKPVNFTNCTMRIPINAVDAGTVATTPILQWVYDGVGNGADGTTISVFKTNALATWTASGYKEIRAQFTFLTSSP